MTAALCWNLLTGRPRGVVRRELEQQIRDAGVPEIVALQECARYQILIRVVARKFGYRVIVGAGSDEAESTVLLVRNDVPMRRRAVFALARRWRGPKGRMHPGRRLPMAAVQLDGVWTRVVAVHGPTGRRTHSNEPAWDETMRRLERCAGRKSKTAIFFVGDWNCDVDAHDRSSVRALATKIRAQVIPTGAPIDYALARGLRVTGKTGPRLGSDHHAHIYTLRRAA